VLGGVRAEDPLARSGSDLSPLFLADRLENIDDFIGVIDNQNLLVRRQKLIQSFPRV
jgi:hypothetical protein